jgi:Polyketide cyclase / dehydrase and lipid transport
MWFELRPEGLDFLRTAPVAHRYAATVSASPPAVFATLANPGCWHEWFPGVQAAAYTSLPPYGVGTIREAHVGGTRWVERLIAWDHQTRWAYTVLRSSVPLASAQVEAFEIEPQTGGTRVQWTLACEPRWLMRLGAPLAPWTIRRVFERAMRNLNAYLTTAAPSGTAGRVE